MLVIRIISLVDPFFAGENTIVTLWVPPGPIGIPFPPPCSVRIGLCFGEVTLAVRIPVPVLLIVILRDAVAPGAALKAKLFGLTEICPGPGDGVAVGVADCVAVAVAVGVAVAVAVGVGVTI